jgi:hypothetical protein
MAITTINPTAPVSSATSASGGAASALVLQPGAVVSAQVQSVLAADLVRIVIASVSLDVASEVPLQAGQNLQLAVSQTPDGTIRLAVVGQGATTTADATSTAPVNAAAPVAPADPNDPLTALERIAVSVASESAATQQQSLSTLFADLNAAAASGNLPPAVQQAAAQVLAQQTSLDANLSGSDIKTAFQQSGLFLESSLAAGSVPTAGGAPDLKAALLVLRQTLASVVETSGGPSAVAPVASTANAAETAPTTPSPALVPSQGEEAEGVAQPQAAAPEEAPASSPVASLLAEALSNPTTAAALPAAALNLLQAALQDVVREVADAPAPVAVAQSQAGEGAPQPPPSATPPPIRGALPSPQPVASSSLSANAAPAATIHRLLDDTDSAIARQTLLQAASLPDRPGPVANQNNQSIPRWNFEIPFATPQGTAMAQFEISRDGGGDDVDPADRVWRARFSLDVEPAGPVHALIALAGGRTSVRMWAERPQTAAQLQAGAAELTQALSQAQLTPGDIVIREGTPPQPAPAKAGHFLDRAL